MKKLIFGCPYCGGEDVLRSAYARWSVAKQEWVVLDLHLDVMCEDCGNIFLNKDLLEREAVE